MQVLTIFPLREVCVCVYVCASCSVPFHLASTTAFFPLNAWKRVRHMACSVRSTKHEKSIQSKSLVCSRRRRASLFCVPCSFCFLIIASEHWTVLYICNIYVIHRMQSCITIARRWRWLWCPPMGLFFPAVFVEHIYTHCNRTKSNNRERRWLKQTLSARKTITHRFRLV